ncbi:MAG: 50S ribosomal protein L11 methyltransferase [Sphingopyxis sp.]|nr:50S ribosomal protein L11 methyltransferase [Sphingopyxis sp.]
MSASLTDVSTHFEFGSNWKDYSEKIDEEAIEQAEAGVLKLIPRNEIEGKTFLDIGSGSGLHSLAALRLGAKSIVALDIDANSVETTRATIGQNWQGQNIEVKLVSILAPEARDLGQFDVVYSWGVLHHTGAMWNAIERAADHVKPGGQFVLAIYRKTPLCWAWKIEKRIFTQAGRTVRSMIRTPFIAAFKLGLRATGRKPAQYVDDYKGVRGMNFYNDIDDWLGGYPYESATEQEIVAFLAPLGFVPEQVHEARHQLGLFGTGCSEFRFRRAG